jgi:hypothetical protein
MENLQGQCKGKDQNDKDHTTCICIQGRLANIM